MRIVDIKTARLTNTHSVMRHVSVNQNFDTTIVNSRYQ